MVSPTEGVRRFWVDPYTGELHRLLGVWSLAFLAVIAATSLVCFYDYVGEQQLGLPARDPHPPAPEVPAETLARLGPAAPERLSLDALRAIAEERAPGCCATAAPSGASITASTPSTTATSAGSGARSRGSPSDRR